jgi:hypothetical protein
MAIGAHQRHHSPEPPSAKDLITMATIVSLPTDPTAKNAEIEYRQRVVDRQGVCGVTQVTLDWRTAVIVQGLPVADDHMSAEEIEDVRGPLFGVMSPEGWQRIGAAFLAHFPDVTLKNAPEGSPGTEAPQAAPDASQGPAPAEPTPDIQHRL